jgi:hypothetical protein
MKKLMIRLGIVLGSLFVILLILPFAFKGKILTAAKNAANSNLLADVKFDDDLSISLIRNFPNVSVGIPNLSIVGRDSFQGDTLYAAQNTRIVLDIKSVLGGETMNIRKIDLDNPHINIIFLKSGRANFDITPVDTATTIDTAASAPISLDLKSIKLSNALIGYTDYSMPMSFTLKGMDFDGSGSLSNNIFTLANELKIASADMDFDGMTLMSKANLTAESNIDMDLDKFKFTFNQLDAKINEFPVLMKGWLQMNDLNMDMDLDISVPSSEFKSLLSVVPGAYTADFKDVKASGKAGVHATLKGIMDDLRMPTTDVTLTVDNGSFAYPGLPASVSGINVDFNLKNADGDPDHTTINLKKFAMNLGGDPISATLFAQTPVSNPYARGEIKAKIALDKWKDVLPLEKNTTLSGSISSDIQFDGYYSTAVSDKAEDLKASGKITVNNLNYTSPSTLPTALDFMELSANPKNFTLNLQSLQYGNSRMSMSGGLENFIGYAINGEVLKGKLTLDAPMIDANQFLTADSDSTSSEITDSSEMAAVQIPDNLDLTFVGSVGVLKYETYDLSNCGAKITVKDGKLNIDELKASIWGSTFRMDQTQYSYTPGSQPVANTQIALLDLNARNIMNQVALIEKYAPALKDVDGIMNLNMQLNTKFSETMDLDLGSLISSGLVDLKKGEMQLPNWLKQVYDQFNWDYGNLSVKPSKLRYIIENGKLTLKDSIGLNLPKGGKMNLAGNVGLDQKILFGGTLQAEGKKVPFTITGTVTDPKFKLDWKKFGKEELKKKLEPIKGTAQQELQKAAGEAVHQVHLQADAIIKKAQEEVANIRRLGKEAADRQRSEGDRLADAALKKAEEEIAAAQAKATNQLEKLAAQKAGDRLRKEAKKSADAIRSKAYSSADRTEQEANAKAQFVEETAQKQAQEMVQKAQLNAEKTLPK